MFVTDAKTREGLLVAVITGGRPKLKERPTRKFLQELKDAGFTNIVWVVAEHHAPDYERDDFDLCVYPSQWARDYAAAHWMSTDPVPPVGGFHGAFAGREWACLEAERRGCWGVLQLDDNIERITFVNNRRAGGEMPRRHGGMGAFADILAAVTLSTNGRMVGASLSSVPEPEFGLARKGFCYSLFIEQVGEGREHWYGPYEDDITHAYQYGTRHDGATAVILPLLKYDKEHKSTSGMRSKYNHRRALQLQRIFPESAKINIRRAKSSGMGSPRIFHTMLSDAIRNPMAVRDAELYGQVRDRITDWLEEWGELNLRYNREKMTTRAQKLTAETQQQQQQ